MVSLFDICTGFQIIVCITLFSGIIYGRHKKKVPLKALVIHNALYLVWAVTVTAVVAKNMLIWWPVFFLAFFISHAIFGKRRKKNWLSRRGCLPSFLQGHLFSEGYKLLPIISP